MRPAAGKRRKGMANEANDKHVSDLCCASLARVPRFLCFGICVQADRVHIRLRVA